MKKNIFNIALAFSIFLLSVNPVHAVFNSKAIFEQGLEAFSSKNWKSAQFLFQKVKNQDDDYRERAHFYLARSIYSQKKYRSAIYEFNSFIGECNDNKLCSEAYFWIGESYSKIDEKTRAIEEYKRYIDNGKKQSLVDIAHDKIAIIYFNQKRYDEAIVEWRKAISLSNNKKINGERVCNIGESYFYNDKIEKALKTIYPILTSRLDVKTVSRSKLIAGQIYIKKTNYRKALLLLNGIPQKILAKYPFFEAQYYKGLSYLKMGNKRKASSFLELFIIIGAKSKWFHNARYELGKIKIENGQKNEGLRFIESARKKTDDKILYKETTEYLSRIYLKVDAKKSIPYLLELVNLGKGEDVKESRFLLGKAHLTVGEYAKAEKIYSFFLKDYPFCSRTDEINFMLGRIYLKLGDQKKAISIFENIKTENPFSSYLNEINFYLALMNYNNQKYDIVQKLLKGYLRKRDSQNIFEANKLLFLSYLAENKKKSAKKYLRKIMITYKKNDGVDVLIYKFAIKNFNDGQKSMYYFKFLVENYPQSQTVYNLYNFLAEYNFKKKRYKLALNYYNQYLLTRVKEKAGNAFFKRIICLDKLKKYKSIISTIKAGNIPPITAKEWEQIPLFLARAFFYENKIEKAYSLYVKIKFKNLTDVDKFNVVKCATSVDDLELAFKYSELINKDQDLYSHSLFLIAEYYLKKGKSLKAEKYFNEVIANNANGDFVEKSKIKLAFVSAIYNSYDKALSTLKSIKKRENLPARYALEVLVLLKIGKEKEALLLARKKIKLINKDSFGEITIKELITFYFHKGDIQNYFKYSNYLKKNKKYKNWINYLSANIYYKRKFYKKAYFYYYKLSLAKNSYQTEALYKLAKISRYKYYKKRRAFNYLKKINSKEIEKNVFKSKALIDLAIMYNELGKKTKSKNILLEIIKYQKGGKFKIQAESLMKQFEFDGENNG